MYNNPGGKQEPVILSTSVGSVGEGFYSPVSSETNSLNEESFKDTYDDDNEDNAEDIIVNNNVNDVTTAGLPKRTRDAAGNLFYSPLPSPALESMRRGEADIEARRNGFYSPLPSPVTVDKEGGGNRQNGGPRSGGPEVDEKSPLLDGTPQVYRRRWYVLVVFSVSCMVQGLSFGTYGPIAQSLEAVFGWTKRTIALLGVLNTLSYVAFAWPVSLLLNQQGLRVTMIVTMVVSTLGLGLRCLSSDVTSATWLNHAGQVCAGLASVLPYSGVSLLSSVWFPPTQRTTATAITTIAGYVGLALSFVIGPVLVPETSSPADNSTSHNSASNVTDLNEQRDSIMTYFYYLTALAGLTLLLVLAYFPAKPPRPPSLSAGVKRLQHGLGMRSLLKNHQFLLILLTFCVGTGVYGGFAVLLNIDLKPLGVSQKTSGWMGFYATIGGCVSGFAISRLSDVLTKRLKPILVAMFVPALATLIWFLLLVEKYISSGTASLYVTIVLPGCFIYGCQALFYELACEAAYPTGEDAPTLVMTSTQNVVSAIFLAILTVPGISVSWVNWLLVTSVAIAVPLLLLIKTDYRRMRIDDMQVEVPQPGIQA